MPDDNTGQGTTPTSAPSGGQDLQVQIQAAAPAPGGTTPPAGEGSGDNALQALLDEQRRIQAGLDKRNQQLTAQLAAYETEKAQLTAQLQEAQGKVGASDTELTSLRQTLETAEAEKAKAASDLQAAQLHAERTQIVATEFPALAPLLAAGALPDAADADTFRQKLGQINSAMTTQAALQYQQMATGVKPPASPAATRPADKDTLHQDMLKALRESDTDTYNRLREEWYAACEADPKK